MRFHWYWPFARVEELAWAHGTLRPGETLLVEVIDREVSPPAGTVGGVTVVRDLGDVDREAAGVRWPLSRARTYGSRAVARRRSWRSATFDLAHVHYVNRFTDVVSRPRCPLVTSVHDVTPHAPRVGKWAEAGLLRLLYRRPDALVVHHQRLADALVSQFRIESSKIFVVPHQVFPVEFTTPLPTDDVPCVLVFGALRPNKGYELLGPMMQELAGVDMRLVVAGRGDATIEADLRALAARDSRVSLEIGFVTLERKRELFRAASVVLLPYTAFASQSGVLHDAYGHGRPVIVTDVGALGKTVTDDQTGVVVPPSHPGELAAAVRRLLGSDDARVFSERALHIADLRSPAAVGRELRTVYDVVMSRH